MKILPKIIALSLLVILSISWSGCERAASGSAGIASEEERVEWLTNYEQALSFAGEQGRPVMILFTGSDWCPPCMALEREVFATVDFNQYAAGNLVLLVIDFPRSDEQPQELVEQNQMLQQRYSVEGLPTVVLVNSEGEEIRRGGYRRGGPRPFIDWVEG